MIVAGTGHRLHRFGNMMPATVFSAALNYLEQTKPDKVISGMALGFDMYLAEAAILRGIPLIAAVPWVGHGTTWLELDRKIYLDLLEKAEEIAITSDIEHYSVSVFSIRNRWMVDRADRLVSFWDGEPDGGTYDAITYATKLGKPIDSLWK